MLRHHIYRGAVITAVSILVGSCGPASTPSSTSGSSHFPVTITGTNGASVTINKQPHRIVSLSATATEMLFAINAGAQVIAVDDQSNYPSNVPKTKLSGFTPNIEAIAGYAPDLVVTADDLGGVVHGMQALNVPILIEPAAKNLDDSYLQIRQLGAAAGHPSEADSLVAKMRSKVGSFVASVSKPAR